MNNLIQIENRQGKIKLNDTVHKESADQLIEELETLYGQSAVASNMTIGEIVCAADDALESVEVEINSPGGSVMEGQRIYNSLRSASQRGVHVVATVNGLAASMGSVILMAGDERKMTAGSRIMIHEASTMAWGDAKTMRKNADILEGISSEIAGIYADRTGGDAADIRNLMLDETWMDTDQAKANGFIHSIIKDGVEENSDVDKSENSDYTKTTTNENTMFKSKDKDLQAKFEASQNEVAEIEASLIKHQAEAVTLTEDLSAAETTIQSMEIEIIELKAQADLVEATTAELAEATATIEAKDAEIEAAKEVTSEAVAAKASELVQMAAHAPVAERDDEVIKLSSDEFWAEYNKIGQEQGLEAKNEWYAENKHRKI